MKKKNYLRYLSTYVYSNLQFFFLEHVLSQIFQPFHSRTCLSLFLPYIIWGENTKTELKQSSKRQSALSRVANITGKMILHRE